MERVILFGSRARGDYDPGSDWDLCILLDDDVPPGLYTPSMVWRIIRDVGLPVQVTPMRRRIFETRRSAINALAHDVAKDGILLFDRAMGPAR
ncbi:nucleotidyltransferase domain-containing protein [Methylobacterium sp. E-005]|nr:nucleotidyltransferase domain-containing protein [Methylobacterium sp. E-005]